MDAETMHRLELLKVGLRFFGSYAWRKAHPRHVGFWHSESEPFLPHPAMHIDVERKWPAETRRAVVEYLHRQHQLTQYMGWSDCRLCGKENGSADVTDGVYTWPSGFLHYVVDHHVKPPEDFVAHVLRVTARR